MPDGPLPPTPHLPKPNFLQTLCEAYADPNLCDKGGEPFVCYGRLVEEVEGVFGVRGLETKPECDVNASVKAAQVGGSWVTRTPLGLSMASAPCARECVLRERSRQRERLFGVGGGWLRTAF